MHFQEAEIEKIEPTDIKDFKLLIIKYLCDSNDLDEISHLDDDLLNKFLKKAKSQGLNYEQFNEALLLLNRDRISKSFYSFFFKGHLLKANKSLQNGKITLEELKKGIINFRGYAMLCFGNFKFAYNKLSKKEFGDFEEIIERYCHDCTEFFRKRPKQMLDIEKIDKDETPYTGYLMRDDINTFFERIKPIVKDDNYKHYIEDAEIQKEKVERITNKAIKNTNTYLTWDYLDIYIATSMRNTWEFLDCYDFIRNLFNRESLKKFKLRYFDPTQCYLESRIDKSLVEGLMLKRAKCCIYMAQESDTLGKDSELASTLAQGKPVIAFIPLFTKSELDDYARKISDYPYDYFLKRIQILNAEDAFTNDKKMEEVNSGYMDIINKFLDNARNYLEIDFRKKREEGNIVVDFFNWKNEQKDKFMSKFKSENKKDFKILCKILAIAESQNFDKRAANLRKYHPLSLQVSLDSGVANGLLVVREIETCSELLEKILTNNLEFKIYDMSKDIEKKENCYSLIENISNCPYRVVTKDIKLTNSFWNFYLNK